jgi:YD repeat-containing protein
MGDRSNLTRTQASEAPNAAGADKRAVDANHPEKTQEKATAKLQNAAEQAQRNEHGAAKTDAATVKSDAQLPSVALVDSQKKQDATALSPEERVKAHISESQDSKTGTVYRYDSQGRITDVAGASGQVMHFAYGDNSNQPSSLSIYGRDGKLISVSAGGLKLDQKSGETVFFSKPDQPSNNDAKLENHYLPDGSLVVAHFDASGRKREQDIVAPSANGNQIVERMVYSYHDAHGKPTEDAARIDNKKPVTCSFVDAAGNVTDKLTYTNAKDMESSHVYMREHFSYANKPQELVEKHDLYAGVGGEQAKPVHTDERTVDKKTGEVTIHTTQVTGVDKTGKSDNHGKPVETTHHLEQTIKLDKHGNAVQCTRQEDGLKAEFTLKDGHVKDVVAHDAAGNKIEDPDIKNNLMNIAELSIAQAKQEKPEAKLPIKQDHAHDKAQEFPKEIADHLAKKDVPGLTGVLKSPDGKEQLAIVGGQIFSTDGKAVGKLGNDGNVVLANHKGVEAVNAFREGWQLEGSERVKGSDGKYHDQYRAFETSPNMVSGRIFIPDEKTHDPVEYEVKMGMVINKKTGEQMGQIRAPSENEQQGTMDGGCLIVGKPPHPIPLANFKNAVFDLQPMGQTGHSGRRLQGICQGPEEVQADGTKRPGSSGGIFDVRAAMDEQDKRAASLAPKYNNFIEGALNVNLGDMVTGQDVLKREQIAVAASRKEMLARCLQNGQVNEEGVQALAWLAQDTKRENLGPHDNLIDNKRDLDSARHVLEPLPKDLSTINGTVRLPGNPIAVDINHGKIVTKEGTFTLCHDQASGQLSLKEQKTGKLTHVQDLPAGTVWHMQYNEKYGHPVRTDWVSMGKDGIASIGELKLQAQAELDYAKNVYQQSHSTKNETALADTANKVRQFNGGLDRIAQGHASAKDLSLLVGNVRDHVRPADSKAAGDNANQPQKLEIPKLATEREAQSVNGKLRIGNDVYDINHGKLYQVHNKDGSPVAESKPCGVLGPGYVVDIVGRQPLHLANADRVAMKITVGNERPHWIIGTGTQRDTDSVGQIQGGLVDEKALASQTQETIDQAHKKNQEYFNEKPYITGSLDNWLSGDREKALKEYEQSCTTMQGQMSLSLAKLKDRTAHLDKDGHVVANQNGDDVFNVDKTPTTKLDGCIGQTQLLMHQIGVTGQDEMDLAEQGKESQKMTANAAVTTVIAAATAGSGVAFGAAVKAGQIGLGMAFAGELATGSATGAVMSAAFRASNSANVGENLGSGAFEGMAMSAGSAIARPFASVAASQAAALSKAEAGLALTTSEKVLLSRTGNIALKTAATVAPAVASSAAFAQAGDIRDHTHTDLTKVGLGTTFMIIAQGVGHMGGIAARETVGVAEDGIAGKTINNVPNMYTYSSLDSMGQIWEQKRQDMEKQYKCDVTDDFMRSHMTSSDWSEFAGKVNQAGLTGALMAPLMTAAVHPIEKAVHGQVIDHKASTAAADGGTPRMASAEHSGVASQGHAEASEEDTANRKGGTRTLGDVLKEHEQKNQELRNLFSDDVKTDKKDASNTSEQKKELSPQEKQNQELRDLFKSDGDSASSQRFRVLERGGQSRVVDQTGKLALAVSYGTDKNNNKIITKVETDESVLTTTDGNKWKVQARSGGPVETITGHLEFTKDAALKFTNDTGVTVKYPDGHTQIMPADMPKAMLNYDSRGALTYLRDATGLERQVTYDDRGVLQRVQSSNGEAFEFDPKSHMYKHIKDGKTENVSFGGFEEDGSFSYRDKDNNVFTRKLDGSLEKATGVPARTTLEEVNTKVEKEKLIQVMDSHVKDPRLQELLHKYSGEYEARASRLKTDPQEIGKTYHYLSELMKSDSTILPPEERAKIAEQILKNAADPWDVNQGAYKTCQVTAMTVKMYATCPSEAARIITDVALHGSFVPADGTQPIVIRQQDILGDCDSVVERNKRINEHNLQKEGKGSGRANIIERSHADQLLQLAAVNAHWQQQTVGPDGKPCAKGDLRYELHTSGKKGDTGERIRNAATGGFLKDKEGKTIGSPDIGTEKLEPIYHQLTGKHEDFVIANASLDRFDKSQSDKTFSTESDFLRMLRARNISEANPLVTEINCNVRPFYEDSGRGIAGGSGGQHELSITGIFRGGDGQWYANIDNQWGPQGQHAAGPGDSGHPVKLHDLFIATQATVTGDLPHTLDQERAGDAIRNLEYWRVSRDCYDTWKKGGNSEAQVQQALAKRSVPVLTPEDYKQQLEWLIKKIDTEPQAFKKNTPIELKVARLTAEATLKNVNAELKKQTADAAKPEAENKSATASTDNTAGDKSEVSSKPEAAPISDDGHSFQALNNEITEHGLTPQGIAALCTEENAKKGLVKVLGRGSNVTVYEVLGLDNFVVSVHHKADAKKLGELTPMNILPDLNVGQPVAEFGSGYTILKRQEGIVAGTQFDANGVRSEEELAKFPDKRRMIAEMPQSAYDNLAREILQVNKRGYSWDASKATNLLVDPEQAKFNLVDVNPPDPRVGEKVQKLSSLVTALMENRVAQYMETSEQLTASYREIVEKSIKACENTGMQMDLNDSSLVYSFKLAGMEPELEQLKAEQQARKSGNS